jgi:hypothetical protein
MYSYLYFWRTSANFVLTVSVAFFVSGCDREQAPVQRPTMNLLSQRLALIFAKTKVVCFSQFVVEVPVTATVIYGPTTVEWPIHRYFAQGNRAADRVSLLLQEVEKERMFLAKRHLAELHRFGSVIDGAVPGQKLIFGSKDQISYTIDSVIPVGEELFVQRAESVPPEKEIEQVALLNAVAKNLQLRGDEEIPAESGACIDGGLIKRQAEYESVAVGIRFKEFPDVHFSIDTLKRDTSVDSDALEPRLKQAEQGASREGNGHIFAQIKTLRRGNREFNNWKGFEILARKPAHEADTEAHEFLFVSLAVPNDPLRPMMELQLSTGVAGNAKASVRPSITDEEAVALWDKLTNSIRVRPTGRSEKNSDDSPMVPLSTFIESGEKCPQTGWWQCSDVGEIAGGRRRHFMAGEHMADAVLLGRPSILQKLMGTRPTSLIPTVWELVSYGQTAVVASSATLTSPSTSLSSTDQSSSDSGSV